MDYTTSQPDLPTWVRGNGLVSRPASASPGRIRFAPSRPYLASSSQYTSTSEVTIANSEGDRYGTPYTPPGTATAVPPNSTVRLVAEPGGVPMTREESSVIVYNERVRVSSPIQDDRMQQDKAPQQKRGVDPQARQPLAQGKEPQLSWVMTLLSLTIVTVVSGWYLLSYTSPDFIMLSQMVAISADQLVESMNGISTTISKEWIGLILLPAVSSIAGECFVCLACFEADVTRSGNLIYF